MGIKNANDAISLLQTADGAMNSITQLAQRMRELSVQSANGTNTSVEREYLNLEYQSLFDEIKRIGATTEFNGMAIISNTPRNYSIQIGSNSNETMLANLPNVSINTLATPNFTNNLSSTTILPSDTLQLSMPSNLIAGDLIKLNINGISLDYSVTQEDIANGTAGLNTLTNLERQFNLAAINNINTIGLGASAEFALPAEDNRTLYSSLQPITTSNGTDVYALNQNYSGNIRTLLEDINGVAELDNTFNSFNQALGMPEYFVEISGNVAEGDIYTLSINNVAFPAYYVTAADVLAGDATTKANAYQNWVSYFNNLSDTVKIQAFGGGNNAGEIMPSFTYDAARNKFSIKPGEIPATNPYFYFPEISISSSTLKGTTSAPTLAERSNTTITITAGSIPLDSSIQIEHPLGAEDGILSGVETSDINTYESASRAINIVNHLIERVSVKQAQIGASSNRITFAANNLMNIIQATTLARSRILDTDYAIETTELARTQIIQQASTAMLAQANQSAQNVLSLLK